MRVRHTIRSAESARAGRSSGNSSLGFADIKLLNTNCTVTNQFLATGTCVRLEMQKLPNQPAGVGTNPVSGSAAT